MNDIKEIILSKIPMGVVAFDEELNIIFSNRQAELFFRRFKLPEEIRPLSKRILDAINLSKAEQMFPGEICLVKKFGGSSSSWRFRVYFCEKPKPFVMVFIEEDSISNRIDPNKIRTLLRLTRRESDVLKRVLNGLQNIDIAHDLEISEQTVKDHLSNIYRKSGTENRFKLLSFLSSLAESSGNN